MVFRCLLALFVVLPLVSAAAPACSVTVAAKGVKGNAGVVGFVLYSSESGWPHQVEKSFKHDAVNARSGIVELKLSGIVPGNYGIVVLHDENENKKLDKKASGRPKEGWGMSRDPKASLKTPKFEAAAIDLKCGDRVEVQMRYPGKEDSK